MRRAVFGLLMTAACTALASAADRQLNLDHWMSRELTPYVAETLATYPRFKGASIRFVVMQDGKPQPSSNALALALRDRLQDALVDTPGIRIAWRPFQVEGKRDQGRAAIDCTADEVNYYVGLELTEGRNGVFRVAARALDLEERSWVSGFGKSWEGPLTTTQYRAYRRIETDDSFRGDRDVPYSESETDMLAAHLAHELGCTLLRQVSGEYVAQLPGADMAAAGSDGLVELVSNNLAAYRALQITPHAGEANAQIEGKAHRVDDDLYQYWITVRPKDATGNLTSLSASAYVYLPDSYMLASLVADEPQPAMISDGKLLASLQLVEVDARRHCRASGFGAGSCFALQARTSDDAVMFFVNHQLNNGLVRLSGGDCARRTSARVARADQSLRFGLPAESLADGSWLPATGWQPDPDADTYLAIAVSDSKAAHAVSQHLERLPRRCAAAVRPGLEGPALRRWLEEFGQIAQRWQSHVDWRAIRVRNMY